MPHPTARARAVAVLAPAALLTASWVPPAPAAPTAPAVPGHARPAAGAPGRPASPQSAARPQPGTLVLVGGALDEDAEILRRIVAEADPDGPGGRSPRIALVTAGAAAAENAQEAADPDANNAAANGLYYAALFERFGATTYTVPVDTTQDAFPGDAYGPAAAESRAVAAQVASADAVFLGGGDQTDYVRTLLRCRWAPDEAYRSCRQTRVLRAIEEVLRRDGVVAGVSAGLTIQQGADMVTGGEPYEAWRDGASPGYFDDPTRLGYLPHGGFGFWEGSLLDSHFATWGRQARMIRLATDTGYRTVVGVDETTALVLDRHTGRGEVIGRHGVSVIRVGAAGAAWSYLTRGDRVDLSTAAVTPASGSAPLSGAGDGPAPREDVWDSAAGPDPGTYGLADLAVALVGSAARTASGVTYEDAPRFVTTLTRVPGTRAWTTSAGTSFSGLRVDIGPAG